MPNGNILVLTYARVKRRTSYEPNSFNLSYNDKKKERFCIFFTRLVWLNEVGPTNPKVLLLPSNMEMHFKTRWSISG